MLRNAKLDLYIILAALIIAASIIGAFWVMNHGKTTDVTFKQPSPATTAGPTAEAEPSESASAKSLPGPGEEELTTIRILVLGDAVAASQGASQKDETGWHALVSRELQGKYPLNFQWDFKTTEQATINNALTCVSDVTAETNLIILCLGRNDWTVLTPKEFKEKYEELLMTLKDKNPSAGIFLIAEPPVKNIKSNNRFFPYRQAILDLGKNQQLPVLDLWSAFIQDPAPLTDLLADGVNPNDQGYRIFASEVLKGFDGVLWGKY
ncbi:lysophospholipase L1-like esterase [Desulfosporosinus orientis DSM 765]|uniref:Lysophospholipase L1-like esterase n=1 Tax=Desulfosporosinus orientis (strain ATCC 19365 / DSM 765 / NCIMB 8382 / VKM B-1628 / Singapore I) TaxID=768706 RepID=G7W775_DESOD|nr:GDSL-type esterase/lipase family protein [Desulfosporosinus orientis]AET70583.1 lysophospholipase L1-like esterase [Desulfosporosinus orientis DSM 765]